MTRTGKDSRRSGILISALGVALLIGCGAQDSQSPTQTPGVVSLVPGQSAVVDPATTLKLDGGSQGSENVLVLTDTSTTSVSAKTSYSVQATGVAAAGTVSAPSSTLIPEGTPSKTTSISPLAGPVLDIGFGMRLNQRSRSRLVPGFRTARQSYASRNLSPLGRSRSVSGVAPAIGDILTVSVGSKACDSVVTHAARVVAIGAQSIVLSDTLNPSGGFTAADYQRFATRFDTLVYPLDVANFGAPADIDQNGKIILLFTEAVNEMTPRNSSSYVGGFFFDRDLFPINSTPDFQGCAGSNVGELFYLLAPDPNGVVNGNIRRTGFVDSVTTSVLAHEFQHLINASRRLFVNNADDFEVTWLNEGLSHIAEELLFYHEAGIASRQNIDVNTIRNTTRVKDAFNADQSANTARYRSFLIAPSDNSPLREDDSLETRGATWDFLRYSADRKGGTETATWQALVNSTTTGVLNLKNVFGTDVGSQLRDWLVSHYTDDLVSGIPTQNTQPSWNFHTIYPALTGAGNTYPLQVKALSAGAGSGTLIGGSAAYYRFAIPANTTATVSVSMPALVQAQVIRVR